MRLFFFSQVVDPKMLLCFLQNPGMSSSQRRPVLSEVAKVC